MQIKWTCLQVSRVWGMRKKYMQVFTSAQREIYGKTNAYMHVHIVIIWMFVPSKPQAEMSLLLDVRPEGDVCVMQADLS